MICVESSSEEEEEEEEEESEPDLDRRREQEGRAAESGMEGGERGRCSSMIVSGMEFCDGERVAGL